MEAVNDPQVVEAIIEQSPELASSNEVAKLLRVEPATVTKWIRHGELHGIKIGKRTTRIRKDDLRTFLLGADEMNLRVNLSHEKTARRQTLPLLAVSSISRNQYEQ